MTNRSKGDRFSRTRDIAPLALRVALALMFLVAGPKLVIPAPFGLGDNRDQLVRSFTDPIKGFMAPWSVDLLTEHGVSVSAGLMAQGILEVLVAIASLAGIATPRFAMIAAMMLVMFTMLSPTGGQVRLSRDLALAAAAIALMCWGGGRWSVDGWYLRRTTNLDNRWARLAGLTSIARGGNRDRGLLVTRIGMVFTLASSAVLSRGVWANPMNGSLPPAILLIAAVVLAIGLWARYVMVAICVWLAVVVVGKLASMGLLIGAENVKREIALGIVAAVAVAGPDRWAFPRRRRLHCREVSDSPPGSPGDPDTSVAGTPHRCHHPKHTQQPNVRAHPNQHSYADVSLGPPTSCGSTGQDQLPDGNPRSHVSEAPAPHTV